MFKRLPSRLGGLPRQLAFRPKAPWIGDAAQARRLLGGVYRLAGREVRAAPDAGPWRIDPPTEAFARALHGFAWLDDLAAADTQIARRAAQSWTFGWIARHGGGDGPGWDPETMALRVMAWLSHADLILHDASADLERRLILSLHDHAWRLRRAPGEEGLPRLRILAGALLAELALSPGRARRRRAAVRLAHGAARTIDAQGGVASRNAEALCEAVILLATAARHMADAGLDAEPELHGAIARGYSALRALRLRDGDLPRFHGGGPGAPGRLEHALSLAHPRTPPPRRDAAMGFVRLAAGRATAVVDAAAPPATREAHAATLAFELAVGARRLVINCGPGGPLGGEWAAACRATAAQSTLSLSGVSSARIAPDARGPGPHSFVRGPRRVTAETADDVEGTWFLGQHDGYMESHGLLHRRRLFLAPDGRDFRGEDTLEAPDARARERADRAAASTGLGFAVRFHLTPEVAAAARLAGGEVILDLPEGAWTFTATGGVPSLADSIYFDPYSAEPRATRQIVVTGRVADYAARVAWAFQRRAPAARLDPSPDPLTAPEGPNAP